MSKSGQKTAIFIAAVILGFFGAYVLSKKFSNKTPQINPGTPAPESESEEEESSGGGGGGMAGGSVSGGSGVSPVLNPTNDTKTPPKVAKGAVKDLPLGTMTTTTVPGSSTTTRSAPPTTGNPTTGVQIVGVILEGANGQGTTTAPTAPTVPSVGTAGAGMTFGTPTTRRTKTIAGFGVNRGTNYLNDCGCQYL
jgi:hypothetical protein